MNLHISLLYHIPVLLCIHFEIPLTVLSRFQCGTQLLLISFI